MEHGDYLQQNDGYTCFYCHTSYEKDLQLAAELGKTLLERNKELETNLRQQQNIVEDRNQEIEYLTKQTAALREVNDSRLRIYEQLEISIQDLERNNQRLVQENINDKKHIKNLYETIESLETRCEDLQHLVDDMGHSKKDDSTVSEGSINEGGVNASVNEDLDDYAKLVSQLEHAKNQRAKEQKKVSELEQNVSYLMKENTNLEEKVCVMQQKDQELKTLQDQIVYLEEIRQGNLCRRCQRSTDPNQFDEYSVYDDDDDTDDISAIGSYVETHKHEVLQQLQESLGENFSEDNPYRILVDKYEALLKIQQKHNAFTSTLQLQQQQQQQPTGPSSGGNENNHCMSLQEELQMSGQFSSFNGNATDDSEDEDAPATASASAAAAAAASKSGAGKYSETETASSSGFSDETSNKCTQTETFFTGSFLCTISDGDDCRFSIYDDASPIESRFRKTPEYRQLFREIFDVLKRAAEAKDEGERLPLLQDDDGYAGDDGCCYDDDDDAAAAHLLPVRPGAAAVPPRVPPATPACENNPLFSSATECAPSADPCAAAVVHHPAAADDGQRTPTADDEQPVLVAAAAAAAPVQQQQQVAAAAAGEQRPRPKKLLQDQPREQQPEQQQQQQQQQRRPRQQRDIIEELASTVKHKKHARHRKSTKQSKDISHLLEFRWTDQVTRRRKSGSAGGERSSSSQRATWCVPRDSDAAASPSSSVHGDSPRHEPAAYASAASQEVAKLKLLEKSYAEVLRLRKPPSNRPQSHYFHRM